MGLDRHIQLGIDVAEKPGKGQPPISSKTPTQSRLPRMACDLATDTRRDDQTLENDGSSSVAQGLEKELKDRHQSRGVEKIVKVVHAEEHGYRVEPCRDEANGYGTHDGNGNHLLWSSDFFRQVRGTVQARKCPIRIDETNNEGYSILAPTGVVDKVSKDE